jgi:hypothetical protein
MWEMPSELFNCVLDVHVQRFSLNRGCERRQRDRPRREPEVLSLEKPAYRTPMPSSGDSGAMPAISPLRNEFWCPWRFSRAGRPTIGITRLDVISQMSWLLAE